VDLHSEREMVHGRYQETPGVIERVDRRAKAGFDECINRKEEQSVRVLGTKAAALLDGLDIPGLKVLPLFLDNLFFCSL
jgi:hypothetical protein